ncbi:Uncharacterized protein XB16_0332 [Leptospira santarosai]|uniref:Uncharacterized protein n=1 Tax=Leptospira santarosai TaxID=28183 RepID=A0A2P1QP48_9LEPT|nr:Uncharacterized protein XB16_0332 [Leptospira santarosai]
MSTFFALLILFVPFCFPFLLYFYYKKVKQYNGLYNKYKDIIDLEKHKSNIVKESNELQIQIDRLKSDYSEKRQFLEKLIREIAIFEDRVRNHKSWIV